MWNGSEWADDRAQDTATFKGQAEALTKQTEKGGFKDVETQDTGPILVVSRKN